MELSKIKEAEGDIASAASILQELQVIVTAWRSLAPWCTFRMYFVKKYSWEVLKEKTYTIWWKNRS